MLGQWSSLTLQSPRTASYAGERGSQGSAPTGAAAHAPSRGARWLSQCPMGVPQTGRTIGGAEWEFRLPGPAAIAGLSMSARALAGAESSPGA